jgi:hypothetical protein
MSPANPLFSFEARWKPNQFTLVVELYFGARFVEARNFGMPMSKAIDDDDNVVCSHNLQKETRENKPKLDRG